LPEATIKTGQHFVVSVINILTFCIIFNTRMVQQSLNTEWKNIVLSDARLWELHCRDVDIKNNMPVLHKNTYSNKCIYIPYRNIIRTKHNVCNILKELSKF
jgi:hypothetical protein